MTYTIGEVSSMLDIPLSTLHYYERAGILTDIEKNSAGHRIYSEENVAFLKIVRCMRHTGMGISEIKNYVGLCQQGEDTIAARHTIFLEQKQALLKQLSELSEYMDYVDKKIEYYARKR